METAVVAYSDYTSTHHIIDLEALKQIQDTYTEHFKDFSRFVEAEGLPVGDAAVREYFVSLNHSGYAAGTKRIKRQAVKKRILQAAENWQIDDRIRIKEYLADLDTFGETKAPKIASSAVRRDKVLSRDEITMLIDRCSERLGLLINFLWTTGCRVNEMTTLTIANCKEEGGKVDCLVNGKGSKERHVFISAAFYHRVREFFDGSIYLFETQGGKPYLNNYVSDEIRKKSRKHLRRTLSAHSLRHSFCTRKIRETGNLKGVSEYVGHSSTAITSDMYDHNLLSDADLLGDDVI